MSGRSGDGVRLSSSRFDIDDTGRMLAIKSVEMEGTRGMEAVDEEGLRRDIVLEIDVAETVRVERGAADAEVEWPMDVVDVFRV
jgi:hypothetical protein